MKGEGKESTMTSFLIFLFLLCMQISDLRCRVDTIRNMEIRCFFLLFGMDYMSHRVADENIEDGWNQRD